LLFSVEDMIKEVDVDGDGRIDFYGKNEQQL
jgi:Ca2+-binding EF-hand superfamily protein